MNLSVLQDLAEIFELLEFVGNSTYEQQGFSHLGKEEKMKAHGERHQGNSKVSERKRREEVLQTSELRFFCKPW